MEKTMLKKIKSFLYLNIGTLLLSVGVYFFKIPNGFATGGVSGIATVLAKVLPFSFLTPAVLIIAFNVLLLIVGFIFVNKQFGVKTVYCTLLYSGLTYVLERLIPLERPLTDQPFLELVIAMILTAAGSALLFNTDASSGGTDIIAMIMRKYTALNVGMALLIADAIVAFSSFFVFGVTTGLFSVTGLFAKAFLVDGIIENLNLCKYFTIITEKPDEICAFIMNVMHRGVTRFDAEGAFSHRNKKVLLAVCRRHEARMLKLKIKEIDPTAFIMVTNSSEILGHGFRSI
ncbi:MAG: YitT family protein [Clostridia bacterium]|nr:YitT family protein [Clostridia bacterium]